MKHFRTPDGAVYAFEADGSQDHLIAADMVAMSDEQVAAHRAQYLPDAATLIRQRRDVLLNRTQWLVDRHTDQLAAQHVRSLTDSQYFALLNWRQSLRDLPSADGFPSVSIPAAPDFVEM